jgi:hypothetical protein
MTKTPQTIDVDKIRQLREHHAAIVRRCDDALALARDIERLTRDAERKVAAVRARIEGDGDDVIAGSATLRPYPPAGPRKGKRKSRETARTTYARAKAARESGTRPTDVIRRIFSEAGTEPVSREAIAERAEFAKSYSGGRGGAEGNANRLVGLALAALLRNREIKETRDGYVARKLQLPEAPPNGAHA